MDDRSLVERFEDCTLPPSSFGHREHLRVAWIYLRAAPFEVAGPRFCASLRRYAAAIGKPDRFHATITWAYLSLVNERLPCPPPSDGEPAEFEEFARANPDLFDPKAALGAHYDPATLGSALARRVFLLPRREKPSS